MLMASAMASTTSRPPPLSGLCCFSHIPHRNIVHEMSLAVQPSEETVICAKLVVSNLTLKILIWPSKFSPRYDMVLQCLVLCTMGLALTYCHDMKSPIFVTSFLFLSHPSNYRERIGFHASQWCLVVVLDSIRTSCVYESLLAVKVMNN